MSMMKLYKRFKHAFSYREENFTGLRYFLQRKQASARLANFFFNAACKGAKVALRTARRFKKSSHIFAMPAQPKSAGLPGCPAGLYLRETCALIAETSLPQCRHYRVTEREEQLRHLGWEVQTCDWREPQAAKSILQLASYVLFYRVPMLGHVPQLFSEARRLGLPILFDIDDLIFDRNLYREHLLGQRLPPHEVKGLLEGADLYREAILASDILLGSTEMLRQLLQDVWAERALPSATPAMRNPCFTVHNSIADTLADFARHLSPKEAHGDEVRMFYGSGTNTHDADFALIADGLREALERDEHLRLYLHGDLELPVQLSPLADRISRISFLDKDTYYRVISDYDIALMPLTQSKFNDAKSNIKYQEASVFRIPSVASPAADFCEAITDGVNGFIARTPDEWRDKILQLASNPALRDSMGTQARRNVLKRYACPAVAVNELLPALPERKKSTGNRLLLVNILFGLNSCGGATMVVEDTARELSRQGFEVFVFTTLHTSGVPVNNLVRYGWNDSSVIAVNSIPGESEQEDGTKIADIFQKTLNAVQPDLVHFHCIQGLGLGLLHRCRETGTPYLITMHDAWWICPRQFMLDNAGSYCAQDFVDPENCCKRCGYTDEEIYRRRSRMREIVSRAASIFTPSDFYTGFVRRNFPRCGTVQTNRNGVRRPSSSRPPRKAGPIRFGYLGGKALHKGYFFLAQTLRALGRTDFELLLVDVHTALGKGAMAGKEDKALWRGLDVRILPFVSHESIDSVYAQMDVLLFPSLWDESFGLTVREAMLRDIFVVAADCGGPREAIVHGENGLLFPKGDREIFSRHLHHILDNKDAFTSYRTTNFGDVIGVENQARELAAAYQNIVRREME